MTASRTILVADEARESRAALADALRCRGYAVVEASDGDEAHRRILEEPPDLVLLDAMLPRRTGIELCRSLKEDERTRALPVFLLTSITRTLGGSDEHWRRETRADAFLSKPYVPRVLYWMIDTLLASGGAAVR